MSREVSTLADKFGEVRRRITDLEEKAQQLREKLIALGQSTVVGEAFIVTVRPTLMREFDMERLRKRISEDQLERCLSSVEHTVVLVHERGSDE